MRKRDDIKEKKHSGKGKRFEISKQERIWYIKILKETFVSSQNSEREGTCLFCSLLKLVPSSLTGI